MVATIHWCVVSVVIRDTMEMEFNAVWAADILSGNNLQKYPDRDNRNMYLIDNLGRRYDHIGTTAGARDGGSLQQEKQVPITGSFIFPPALPGATTFAFHDDDQGVVIPFIQVGSPG